MSPYTCLIFDMDGTLTDTNRLIFDSFNHVVVGVGREPMEDMDIVKLFGPPEEGALEQIVGRDRVQDAMTEYLRYYRQNHSRLASIHGGIHELLIGLKKKGLTLAVFTGKGTHTARITLEEFGLSDLFDVVVTGNDVEHHKPSGEGIRNIMERTCSLPDETLMIGDSVSDIRAARDAGVKVAAVLWNAYAADNVRAQLPDFTFTDVESFASWMLPASPETEDV